MQFFLRSFSTKFFAAIFAFALAIPSNIFAFPSTELITPYQFSDDALREETSTNIANDNYKGEDLEIRRAAVEALAGRAGTIVVMNAKNGRIYTIVNQDWAIRNAFKPCSTIKLVTGIAGYSESLIKANGALSISSYRIGLDQSLAYSNNTFFQKVGKNLGSKKLISYARRFGLGEPTGINAEGETAGELPYGNENLRIYSHADDFRATPLQLAVMVSAITNGGDLVVPQIPRTKYQKTNFRGYFRRHLSMDPATFERVIPGMMGAVKYGTAKSIRNANLNIAGKTGSCISDNTWVGLFASVAPIQNPKYAVVVILKGKHARGKYSASIAEKIYQTLQPHYKEPFKTNLALKRVVVKSAPSKTNKTRTNAYAGNIGETKIIKVKSSREPAAAKTIIIGGKSAQKRAKKQPEKTNELFKTVVINGRREITRPRVIINK